MEIEAIEKVPLFLGQMDKCLLTLEERSVPNLKDGIVIGDDHLVPEMAGKKHNRLLKAPRRQSALFRNRIFEIIESRENKVNLCAKCHRLVDEGPIGKMKIYRLFGLVGLIEQIALYPRSPDQHMFAIQYHQWRELFTMLSHNFRVLKDIPEYLQSDYSQAADLVGRYLYRWEQGCFDQHSLSRKKFNYK